VLDRLPRSVDFILDWAGFLDDRELGFERQPLLGGLGEPCDPDWCFLAVMQ
jgi:hypothetical protein